VRDNPCRPFGAHVLTPLQPGAHAPGERKCRPSGWISGRLDHFLTRRVGSHTRSLGPPRVVGFIAPEVSQTPVTAVADILWPQRLKPRVHKGLINAGLKACSTLALPELGVSAMTLLVHDCCLRWPLVWQNHACSGLASNRSRQPHFSLREKIDL
jgi:hypothetical protein